MALAMESARPTGFAATERRDAWWVAPLVQGLLLAALICYANWAAIQGDNYDVPHAGGGRYLSPFYSPLIKPSWFTVLAGAPDPPPAHPLPRHLLLLPQGLLPLVPPGSPGVRGG